MEMMLTWMLIMTILTPIMCIASFIVGYNINAQKKIFKLPEKKAKPTEDELMLERIEKATVYKTEI